MQPAFHIVTNGESYPELVTMSRENGALGNQKEGWANMSVTWLIQFWQYGPAGSGADHAVPV